MKRKTILILFAIGIVVSLIVYWVLLALGMEEWAENLWLAWMVYSIIVLIGGWLALRQLDYTTRKLASRLSRYKCPVCGAVYDGELGSCPHCGNRTM